MIDYTRLIVDEPGLNKYLKDHLALFDRFQHHTSLTNGGKQYEVTHAFYNGLRFTLPTSNLVIIEGSLHKYRNGGVHNHDDFKFEDLMEVIYDLCYRFKINPQATKVQHLEFGVNIHLPFEPGEFIDRSIFLLSKAGVKKPSPIIRDNGDNFNKGIRFDLLEYSLKIYDKGKQYGVLGKNILRLEYKAKKCRAFKKADILTLADLCSIDNLQKLANNYLFPMVDCLLVDEIIIEDHLSTEERQHYHYRLDYLYWKNTSRNQRKRNKVRLRLLFHRYALSDFKSIVMLTAQQKTSRLLTLTSNSLSLSKKVLILKEWMYTESPIT